MGVNLQTIASACSRPVHWAFGSLCPACGKRSLQRRRHALWDELVTEWGLDARWTDWFNEREGRCCARCYSSRRAQHMASVITGELNRLLGTEYKSLRQACRAPEWTRLSVAEINSCGSLHYFLRFHPSLAYSEFGSSQPGLASEDITALSYNDEAFDIVLTSETLEHVPDARRALRETWRVLRPGGRHIFTIPVVWDRSRSRQRAAIVNGAVVHHLPPTYHGAPSVNADDFLVFSEFGADVTETISEAGFDVSVVRDNANPAVCTFIATKPLHF
jgi:SAM-dependent methyltransferase